MRVPTIRAVLTTAALATAALAYTGPAAAENGDGPTELAWNWDEPRRIYIEAEVLTPQPIWFTAEFNKEQRAIAFQVRAVLACGGGEVERKRVREVLCAIEDIGVQAAGMPAKEGLLQPILEELDDRLSESQAQLQVRVDGRIVNLDMEGLDRRNRRVGAMNENLRLVMSRALAGLDLEFPDSSVSLDEVWPQYHNWVMQAPSAVGTSGMSELLHKLREVRPDGTVLIETGGRGMIIPGETTNKYDTKVVAFAIFDPEEGFLVERTWAATGIPTASSGSNEGGAGLHYIQRGRMKLLGPDEQVDVGETAEVSPPGVAPTTLQLWPSLGATPNPIPE